MIVKSRFNFVSIISKQRIIQNSIVRKNLKLEKSNVEKSLSKVKEILYNPIEALEFFNKYKEDYLKTKTIQQWDNISIRLTLQLNLKNNQILRGVRECPGGYSKYKCVCALCPASHAEKAIKAGAKYVASTDVELTALAEKNFPFSLLLATNEMTGLLKTHAKVLGPRGLMPSPKIGTQIELKDLETSIIDIKNGKEEYKVTPNKLFFLGIGKMKHDKGVLANLDFFLRDLATKIQDNKDLKHLIKHAFIDCSGLLKSCKLDIPTIDPKTEKYFYTKI